MNTELLSPELQELQRLITPHLLGIVQVLPDTDDTSIVGMEYRGEDADVIGVRYMSVKTANTHDDPKAVNYMARNLVHELTRSREKIEDGERWGKLSAALTMHGAKRSDLSIQQKLDVSDSELSTVKTRWRERQTIKNELGTV